MDPWVVTAPERAKHDEQFASLGPSGGVITGHQAKSFLLQSQLPPAVLGKIWSLADHDADGKMDRNEFSVACKLITMKLRGMEVPATLPMALQGLLTSPVAAPGAQFGGTGTTHHTVAGSVAPLQPSGMAPGGMAPGGMAPGLPPGGMAGLPPGGMAGLPPGGMAGLPPGGMAPGGMAPGLPPAAAQMGVTAPLVTAGPVPLQPAPLPARPRSDSVVSQESVASASGEWAVPQASRLKYTQTFNQHDRAKSGYLSGPQARNVLLQSGLPNTVLAQIWSLCDVDQDGRLSCEEFVLALHLCERTRLGDKLANTLPAELVPPSFRRRRTTSTGSQPADAAADAVTSPLSQGSFEDRRRENYNKGQAELERRRRLLEEAQRREQEERARKEREEQEKLERARQEQERRRQEEQERQEQRRRELELQQEEARRRELEQREAARREMERKRQEEWEVQKRQELENQRQKQQEVVLKLKAQNTNLTVQLNSATDRVKDLTQQISDTRTGVTEVKATIDGMRATRDANMAQLTALKAQLRQHNNRLMQANQERAQLEARNKLNDANNPVAAGLESTAMNYDSKQHIIEQLRERASTGDTECSEKERELAARLESLREAKEMLNALVSSCQEMHAQHETKRQAVLQLRSASPGSGAAPPSPGQPAWAADFAAADAWGPPAAADAVTATATGTGTQPTGWVTDAWGSGGSAPAADGEPWGSGVTAPTAAAQPWASPKPATDAPCRKVAYRALYEFQGRSNDEVSFKPGDIVMINLDAEAEVSWLEGEVNGHTGWLPESYVEKVDADGSAAVSVGATNGTPSAPSQVSPPAPQTGPAERYVALFTYESAEPGDLVFQQGDVISVTEKHGEWWTGHLGSASGIFPSNYVQLMEDTGAEPESASSVEQRPQWSQPAPVVDESRDYRPPAGLGVGRAPSVKKRRGEVAVAIAPYDPTSAEQLTLQRGQLVMVRKKSETGWWEGEIQTRGKQRQVGWFPASFVKLKTSRRMSLPDETEPPMPAAQCPGDAPAPSSDSPKATAVAQFAYTAQNDDELTFQADEVITIINKDDISWWKGELNGVVGLFPSNYVTEKSPQSPCEETQWRDSGYSSAPVPEVTSLPAEVTSHPPEMTSLSEEERQRQEAISELVTSEEAYLTSLSLVTEVFRRPLVAAGLLSREEARMLFVNWSDLVKTSRKLAVALRVRRKMSPTGVVHIIGDILCENLPHMTSYLRFCSCQLRAATLLQRKVQSPQFDELVRRCQSDPRAAGMPLSSFLLKPTQRVTKYPLLIKQILKHTGEQHADHANLEEALHRAEELCKQVNEGVREQQNSDRLEWLQDRVDCSEIPEMLVFNSLTNAVGPRRLLHFGLLNKTKSGREVVAFLFNDFLLLTTPSRQLGNVGQIEFDRSLSNLKFKLYKKPVLLGELEVTSQEAEDALQLSCPGHVISLTASSRVARDLWLKQLSGAQETFRSHEQGRVQRQHSREAKFVASGRLLAVVMSANHLVAAGPDVYSKPKGNLLVTAFRGIRLEARDPNGKSDPYCELTMGSQVQRTPVIESTLNPRWNHSMQFLVKDLRDDVLCISVFDRDHFSPNEFLGRTELRLADIYSDRQRYRGPVIKRMPLYEVKRGEVDLKLDLQLFTQPE